VEQRPVSRELRKPFRAGGFLREDRQAGVQVPFARGWAVVFVPNIAETVSMSVSMRLIASLSLGALLASPVLFYGQIFKKSEGSNHSTKQSDKLSYSSFDGQPAPSKMLLANLQRQVLWDEVRANADNSTGIQLRFQKIDEQAKGESGAAVRYRVFAAGAPEDAVFGLRIWRVGKEMSPDASDIYVNGQGLLLIHKPKPEQEMSFSAAGDEFEAQPAAGNAEPVRYLLFSLDGRLQIFGTLVPHPLVSEDNSCTLEVRIADPQATAVLVITDRFPANAKVPVVLESVDKTTSAVLTTDSNGHAVMAGFPYVPGHAQGTFKATGEGPHCLPSVVLPWGPASPPTEKAP
jgi:hypothetical protein